MEKELVLDPTKFLNFEHAKVQVITLDQLKKTHEEVDVSGNPLKGIFHYALLERIISMCNEHNFNVEVYDMFAAQNRDRTQPGVVRLPQVEAIKGERAVEAHVLRRVFANIRITDFDDAENTTNLAVAFHQRGIQVGFGNMVKICHNQCMLGADQYASTYKQGELAGSELEELFTIVGGWLTNAESRVFAEREKAERMKHIHVPAERMYQLIGLLTTMRVAHDTKVKSIRVNDLYPLNQSQISEFTEDMLMRYKNNNEVTVWDLYDGATNLYKANRMDIPNLLPQNIAMVKFLDEQFELA